MNLLKVVLISIILCSFICLGHSPNQEVKFKKPIKTAIDSLQGYWHLQINPNITCNISRSNFIYKDSSNGYYFSDTSNIYFSDTIVNEHHDFTINEIQIDANKKTGAFLILVSLKDSMVDCYKYDGVFYDRIDTIFSITDVWNKRKTLNFKK